MKRICLLTIVGLAMFFAAHSAHAELDLLTQTQDDEIIVGVKYTSSYFGEFAWGLSRPFHFYNTEPDGSVVLFPFWTHPMQEGGLLSWLNPESWEDNPNLTVGALASEITIAVLVGSAGN